MATKKGTGFVAGSPELELGTTGIRVSGGRINEEFLPALMWPKSNSVYKEMMENDPIIGGMMFAVEMVIRKVEWSMEPADDTAQAKEMAVFFTSCMNDMEKSWPDVINDILSFLGYGYSVHEKVYKLRVGQEQTDPRFYSSYTDGLWGWRKFPARSQDSLYRWVFNGDWEGYSYNVGDVSNLTGVIQRSPNNFKEIKIPREKFLLFRNNSRKDNPESRSILRNAYRPWYFKKTIEEIEAIGIERDLKGIPVIGIPPAYLSSKATAEQKAVADGFRMMATSLRSNEQAGVLMPLAYNEQGKPMFTLELLGQNSSGGKNFDTGSIIQRYNSNIAQTILADFILLGQQSVGSFALSTNKVQLFHSAISAWLDNIADTFNKDAIAELTKLNGWDIRKAPSLVYGTIDNFSLLELAEALNKFAAEDLLTPDTEVEAFIRKRMDIPSFKEGKKTKEEKIADTKAVSDKYVADVTATSKTESASITATAQAAKAAATSTTSQV